MCFPKSTQEASNSPFCKSIKSSEFGCCHQTLVLLRKEELGFLMPNLVQQKRGRVHQQLTRQMEELFPAIMDEQSSTDERNMQHSIEKRVPKGECKGRLQLLCYDGPLPCSDDKDVCKTPGLDCPCEYDPHNQGFMRLRQKLASAPGTSKEVQRPPRRKEILAPGITKGRPPLTKRKEAPMERNKLTQPTDRQPLKGKCINEYTGPGPHHLSCHYQRFRCSNTPCLWLNGECNCEWNPFEETRPRQIEPHAPMGVCERRDRKKFCFFQGEKCSNGCPDVGQPCRCLWHPFRIRFAVGSNKSRRDILPPLQGE